MSASRTPASPDPRVSSRIRFSWLNRRLGFGGGWTRDCGREEPEARVEPGVWLAASDSIFLQPSVERAAAQTERISRLADVSAIAVDGFADQQGLHLFQAEILHPLRAFAPIPQAQIADSYQVSTR